MYEGIHAGSPGDRLSLSDENMEDVAAYEDDQPQEVGLQPRETFINTQRGSVPGEGNAFGQADPDMLRQLHDLGLEDSVLEVNNIIKSQVSVYRPKKAIK